MTGGDEIGAEAMFERGIERATVPVELHTALIALLEREADEQDTTVEELAERWLSLMWFDHFRGEYGGLTFNVEIDVPPEAYRRAELYAAASGNNLDEVLFDILAFDPVWTVDEQPVND